MPLGIGKNMSFDFETAARVLSFYCQSDRPSVATAEGELGYNSAKIFGFRSWLHAMGMLEIAHHRVIPSSLAAVILSHDPELVTEATARLLYYEISSNPSAEVWYALVNHVLHSVFSEGLAMEYGETREALSSLGVGLGSAAVKQRDKDAALSLRALTSLKAFGRMNLVAQSGIGGRQLHLRPQPPDRLMLAYDLVKRGQSRMPYHRLADISAPGRVARVFFWSPAEVEEALGVLESENLARVVWSAGLNQVAWIGPKHAEEIAERMYEKGI